jgi:hypothetical protein
MVRFGRRLGRISGSVWDAEAVTGADIHPPPVQPDETVWSLDRSGSAQPADVLATRQALQAHQSGIDQPIGPRLSPLRAFVIRYGWRAYALPILAVVTIVALLTAGHSGAPRSSAAAPAITGPRPSTSAPTVQSPPTAVGDQALKTDDPGTGSNSSVLASADLPDGDKYTTTGTGAFTVLKGVGAVVGSGPLHRYDIEVENGITGIDLKEFAAMVQATLSDRRSWTAGTGDAAVSLQRVDSGYLDFRVTLTSSMTVRALCGYDIPVETSCFDRAGQNGSPVNRVLLNDARWVRGDAAYIADLSAYRTYMVNHEVGHGLGHQHAHACLASGIAPVMMQQTIGLRTSAGTICQANPWPFPPGVKDAPGIEAPDTPLNNEFNLQNE